MKKITSCILGLALFVFACKEREKTSAVEKSMESIDTATAENPINSYLTGPQLQEQVDNEIINALKRGNDSIINEAREVVDKTSEAIVFLQNGQDKEAIKAIAQAIGKAEVIISVNPELSFVPMEVEVMVQDMITDINMVKQIEDDVETLTDKGYLQAARHMLNDLASEISIRTRNLPLVTYPVALKLAATQINDKQFENAIITLNSALNTIAIEDQVVPLPIIRAERILAEVDTLLLQKDRQGDIKTLLDNADYQIRFAEALGYGRKDREFEELYDAIKDIRKEVEKTEGGTSNKLVPLFREKLKAFKERISPGTKQLNQK